MGGGGLTDEDLRDSAKAIQDAIVVQMKNILMAFRDPTTGTLTDNFPNEIVTYAEHVIAASKSLAEAGDAIEHLWAHQAIKDAYTNRSNLGISDNIKIFLDDLVRIKQEDYMPTAEDLILARISTAGMNEKQFTVKGAVFNIFDVGGQRSERTKWIHQFDSVHAVLFVSSLACYDQMLYEQNDLNAMAEALELFGIVGNSRYFGRSSIILFLNKSDIFKQKIKTRSLKLCFPEYDGDQSYGQTTDYILQKFMDQVEPHRQGNIYHHLTCFMDPNNVERVFYDVQDTATNNALRLNGLM